MHFATLQNLRAIVVCDTSRITEQGIARLCETGSIVKLVKSIHAPVLGRLVELKR